MTVRSLERAHVALLVLDASEGMTDQDAKVANLVIDNGCAAVVIANKWDLVAGDAGDEILDAIAHGLRFVAHVPVLTLSALTGARVPRLWTAIEKVHAQAERQISTSELNRWLEATVAKHEPSMARRGPRRRPIRFFYATQTGTSPPTFMLFCTDPQAILPSYRRFLENQLRDAFGFEGTPVRLRLRGRNER